jgi:diguanylate cyclase (GGDEF)-like protein
LSELDPRSLIVVAGLLGLLCSVILFILRRSFPPTIGGLVYWSRGLFCLVGASALFGMTGHLPYFLSVLVANLLLVAGIGLLHAGFRHFAGLPVYDRLLAAGLAVIALHVGWFTYVDDLYRARAMLVTSINCLLFLDSSRVVLRTAGKTLAGRFTCLMLIAIGVISAVRVATLALESGAESDLLDPSAPQKIYLAAMAFTVLAITLGAMMMANERLRTALEFIASHDQLTDAYSRRAFIELLNKELARSMRYQRSLALLMCDLDSFKAINDHYGHSVGDRVIVDFVQRAKALLRTTDSIGRYGGEEFIVLLPETSAEHAKLIAERLCTEIAAATTGGLPRYTVSIGIASLSERTPDIDKLLSHADEALYRAKGKGRNRAELAAA